MERRSWLLLPRVQTSLNASEQRKISEEARQKYHNIFENSILGLYQSIPSGRYLSVNPAFARLFGYKSPEEMLDLVDDIGQQLYANSLDRERAIRLVTKQGFLEGFELEVKIRDGTRRWVSMNTRIVKDQDGIHFDGTVEDITKRKLAEEMLRSIQGSRRGRDKIQVGFPGEHEP